MQLQLLVCGRNPKNLLEKKKKGEKIEGKKKKVFDFFLLILSLSPFWPDQCPGPLKKYWKNTRRYYTVGHPPKNSQTRKHPWIKRDSICCSCSFHMREGGGLYSISITSIQRYKSGISKRKKKWNFHFLKKQRENIEKGTSSKKKLVRVLFCLCVRIIFVWDGVEKRNKIKIKK